MNVHFKKKSAWTPEIREETEKRGYGSISPKCLATVAMSRMSILPSASPDVVPVMSQFASFGKSFIGGHVHGVRGGIFLESLGLCFLLLALLLL